MSSTLLFIIRFNFFFYYFLFFDYFCSKFEVGISYITKLHGRMAKQLFNLTIILFITKYKSENN